MGKNPEGSNQLNLLKTLVLELSPYSLVIPTNTRALSNTLIPKGLQGGF